MPLKNRDLRIISFITTMMLSISNASDVEQFSRTDIGILGVDILHLNTDAAIQKAIASGNLVRVGEGCTNADDMQLVVRGYFTRNCFYSAPFGYFMAFRNSNIDEFQPVTLLELYQTLGWCIMMTYSVKRMNYYHSNFPRSYCASS